MSAWIWTQHLWLYEKCRLQTDLTWKLIWPATCITCLKSIPLHLQLINWVCRVTEHCYWLFGLNNIEVIFTHATSQICLIHVLTHWLILLVFSEQKSLVISDGHSSVMMVSPMQTWELLPMMSSRQSGNSWHVPLFKEGLHPVFCLWMCMTILSMAWQACKVRSGLHSSKMISWGSHWKG